MSDRFDDDPYDGPDHPIDDNKAEDKPAAEIDASGWDTGDVDVPDGVDAAGWASGWTDMDESFLGEEAAVPPGEYGPPIASHLPGPEFTPDLREIERRMSEHRSPMFPIEPRRRLPFEDLLRRYSNRAMRRRADFVDEYGRDPVTASRVEPVLDFLHRTYFRVSVHGLENVPASGRAILVANHSGTLPLDGLMLMHAIRKEHPAHREARPLVEDFLFHFPYLGTYLNRVGAIRACQENAERLLRDDELIAVFPEGVKGIGKLYRDRYKLQRFGRGGFVKLALRTGAPIIPVAIIGAEESMPMLGRLSWFAKSVGIPYVPVTPTFPWLGPAGLMPLPAKWSIHFGEPIDVADEHGSEAASDRILVNRVAEGVRLGVQTMIDSALANRNSVLRG